MTWDEMDRRSNCLSDNLLLSILESVLVNVISRIFEKEREGRIGGKFLLVATPGSEGMMVSSE